MYSAYNIEELISLFNNKKLIFIHTPKCAGSFVSTILRHLKIESKGHVQAIPNEGITFTVIRNPVDRFESLLNYRLCEKFPRNDWPKHLAYVFKDETITLNEIISKMTNEQILGFYPYRTLNFWSQNVDIIITLEELPNMLRYFGYTYDQLLFAPENVSKKTRGKLNKENSERIKLLYKDDVILYNNVINSTL